MGSNDTQGNYGLTYRRYREWLEGGYIDPVSKDELRSIEGNQAEIEDRFYRELEFGTAGLRGVIGAGTNRMNIYIVRKATQGLASYLLKCGNETKAAGVVIGYDNRSGSSEFAAEAAAVLNGNGIFVHFFAELKPVPLISFAVRELGASAGICITASHNPKEYNGYKVYGPDGGQLSTEASSEVQKSIAEITDIKTIRPLRQEEAEAAGLFRFIGPETENSYYEMLKSLRVSPGAAETAERKGAGVNIVYTPLYGTGNKPVKRILAETGFKRVFTVPEQEGPDPSFPTVRYPNPEEYSSFELALKYAAKTGADLILGTDPDCDRIGVVEACGSGGFRMLTGNQAGYLLMEYIFSRMKEEGSLPGNAFAIISIVTGRMAAKIAKAYNVKLVEVFTGFKFFAGKIKELDETESGSLKFVFGFEESYGYLAGSFVRDKDAVCAAMLIAEMTAWYASKGMTLHDVLEGMYTRYGWHTEKTISVTVGGKEGAGLIVKAMAALRDSRIREFGGCRVKMERDFKNDVVYDYGTAVGGDILKKPAIRTLGYPESNVLHYEMEDGSWFAIRPSGTEPKIKYYFGSSAAGRDEAEMKLERLKGSVTGLMDTLMK